MTADKIMENVVKSVRDATSLNVSISGQVGSTAFKADVTMARDKFTFKSGQMQVFYDGSTQWTVDTDSKAVSITTPTAEELAETNPLHFINTYKNNYKAALVSSGAGTYTVKLTANRKSSYIRSAQVVVSSSTWLPTHITAQLSTGKTLTMRINSATKGSALPLSAFRFDKKNFPKYEIIDLR